jgi:hypothetical protein
MSREKMPGLNTCVYTVIMEIRGYKERLSIKNVVTVTLSFRLGRNLSDGFSE